MFSCILSTSSVVGSVPLVEHEKQSPGKHRVELYGVRKFLSGASQVMANNMLQAQ